MSLFLSRLSRKPELLRRSFLLLSKGFSTSLRQTHPCFIIGAKPCPPHEFSHDNRLGTLRIINVNQRKLGVIDLEKKVSADLVYNDLFDTIVTIGASHGWVASLKDDGLLRLHDDLNPYALYADPICVPLPPLVTLPHCQTQIVTNVSMSSSSPEDDEDCVVAVKFLGPQLSFCKPAGKSKPEWTNIKIQNPCFYSSRVMFSKKDNMFRIPGSGGHLIGSWDPHQPKDKTKLQTVRFQNLPPNMPTPIHELIDSCLVSQHLVKSPSTGETFLAKQYSKRVIIEGVAKMKTEFLMVYKLDEEGNAVYTQDMGDLTMFLSKSEPFCVPSTFPGLYPNWVYILDSDEHTAVHLMDGYPVNRTAKARTFHAPYFIPPQNIVD